MIIDLFHKNTPKREKPPYLDRIDEFPKLDIVRLKGKLDKAMVPVIESRIKENRKMGSTISKNILIDFAQVTHVDSSLVAIHILHFKEYQAKGFTIAFINVTKELKVLLDIFREKEMFRIFATEEEALSVLNR